MCESIHENGKCCGECDRAKESAYIECDGCNLEHHREEIEKNWKGSGWNMCLSCREDVPDYALELIDERNAQIVELFRDKKRINELLNEAFKIIDEFIELSKKSDDLETRVESVYSSCKYSELKGKTSVYKGDNNGITE